MRWEGAKVISKSSSGRLRTEKHLLEIAPNDCTYFRFKQPQIAARALATYLIPGCVGRGVRLGSESSSGAGGGVWKSGNQNWPEMGPYGSIWLDTAAKMIVRTSRIFFVFKKSLKICLGVQKRAMTPKKFCLGVQKRGP